MRAIAISAAGEPQGKDALPAAELACCSHPFWHVSPCRRSHHLALHSAPFSLHPRHKDSSCLQPATAVTCTGLHEGLGYICPGVLQEGPQVEGSPLQVELPAVAWLGPQAFGGSLPSVVEWLPVPPHDLLLVDPLLLLFLWCSPLALQRISCLTCDLHTLILFLVMSSFH